MDPGLVDLSEAFGETLCERVPDSLCAVCFAGGHECPAAHHAGARNIGLCTPCREGRNCEVFATQATHEALNYVEGIDRTAVSV